MSPFRLLKSFPERKGRYLTKMLKADTSDQETLNLKAVLNALDLMSPTKIAEATCLGLLKKLKHATPDMFR